MLLLASLPQGPAAPGFSILLGWAYGPRNPMKNRAGTRMGSGFVGQLDKLRPIGNRPTAALARDSGGNQPPRRLPTCPTSVGHVVLKSRAVFRPCRCFSE